MYYIRGLQLFQQTDPLSKCYTELCPKTPEKKIQMTMLGLHHVQRLFQKLQKNNYVDHHHIHHQNIYLDQEKDFLLNLVAKIAKYFISLILRQILMILTKLLKIAISIYNWRPLIYQKH